DEEPITCRPADLLEPELPKIRQEGARYITNEEDVLTKAMFPKPADDFFRKREAKLYAIDNDFLNEEDCVYPAP
ncbi:MAG: oxaloacetate decarboxylase subunit alpha, partial [Firmicutes bacterium]|nr:oxaloacetate decarboxylase subunit alpha [Bacillota bacterium]